MRKKQKSLTPEDQNLWEQVCQKIKPLEAEKRTIVKPLVLAEAVRPFPPLGEKMVFMPFHPDISSYSLNPSPSPTSSRQAKRVRKVAIEARLDLHGLTHHQARLRLAHFLCTSQIRNCVWVLIITGKGRRLAPLQDDYANPPRKTLRELAPQWLDDPLLHPVVAAYATAKPQDGGSGALYVRLKKLPNS